jgi:hypothetical protein
MPSDFDWIFKRDPYWRERSKEDAPAIPRSHNTQVRAQVGAAGARRAKSSNQAKRAAAARVTTS